mmetsp:Transcript_40007/g.63234  ORF Transcript_40007/g.63234 Transcript_40007/m.63234 type:complete len:241 (-) Transcript_40007:25-747(-)|eukprot:CAMPEP_0201522438 /NCGR_PEP_ID=MMETSP0161_2-20130828/17437_1 /ASSEMBLY_ACC=CAM_ASM_000251 /TAXON_ID=180227 /ORGANISM="Neoparamoeba aestuarina, Strain SoJaBio B1-5/56/2" /LENGTH=240 /DNA_ID=CAMNT_0047921283 /DNA_START=36 /DNA_END=758 /DNA_ORIENTATION=+
MSEPALREYTRHQIQKQVGDQPSAEVEELSLAAGLFDGIATLREYTGLLSLDVVAMVPKVTASSLECDPDISFQHLQKLNLSDNAITRLPEGFWKTFPNIHTLELSNNKIGKDASTNTAREIIIDAIGPLTHCTKLKNLALDENLVCKLENYREIVYSAIPSLEVLDYVNKAGEDVNMSEEVDDETTSSEDSVSDVNAPDDAFVEEDSDDEDGCYEEESEEEFGEDDEAENESKKMKLNE